MGAERTRTRYPAERRERAVWMVRDHEGCRAPRSAAARLRGRARWAAAGRRWGGASALRRAERDGGVRPGPTSEERERGEPCSAIGPRTMASALEREVRELRQAEEPKVRAWQRDPVAARS